MEHRSRSLLNDVQYSTVFGGKLKKTKSINAKIAEKIKQYNSLKALDYHKKMSNSKLISKNFLERTKKLIKKTILFHLIMDDSHKKNKIRLIDAKKH